MKASSVSCDPALDSHAPCLVPLLELIGSHHRHLRKKSLIKAECHQSLAFPALLDNR